MGSFFSSDRSLKAISIVLAFFIWLLVRGGEQIEKPLKIDVVTKNQPKDLVLISDVESEITIRVRGPRTRLSGIESRMASTFNIDLTGAHKGINQYRVSEESFSLPYGTRVVRVSPQVLTFEFDREEERVVKVDPHFVGDLPEGFELKSFHVFPNHLRVRGAAQELAKVKRLITEPILLNERTANFEDRFQVRRPTGRLEIEDDYVSVRVEIFENEITKVLENIPIVIQGDKRVHAQPGVAKLKIKGPAGLVYALVKEPLQVVIDGNKINKQGTKRIRYKIDPPRREGVEISVMPSFVHLTFPRN